MSQQIELAVIGGSGFYEMPGLSDVEQLAVETPFGPPSDVINVGSLDGARVAFLARHGRNHQLLPWEIPQRANIWALKSLGVRRVLSISAVGSLREDCHPGDVVIPDQLIDRTSGTRPGTFFGNGLVAHVGFSEPFCPDLRSIARDAVARAGGTVHHGGSYIVIEGPAFGTRAESHLYRSWGASLVGMTALPEAKLAREAELCYAILATVTDYDAWHDGHEPVDADTVFKVLRQNVRLSQDAVRHLVAANAPSAATPPCTCATALDAALVTPAEAIPPEAHQRLAPILSRRVGTVPR